MSIEIDDIKDELNEKIDEKVSFEQVDDSGKYQLFLDEQETQYTVNVNTVNMIYADIRAYTGKGENSTAKGSVLEAVVNNIVNDINGE